MKLFTSKTFWFKLIVCFCFCLALFGLGISTVSQADTSWGFNTARSAVMVGGKLIEPVVDLLLGIGDAIINVIQQAIMGTEAAITIDTALKVIFVIVAVVAAILAVGFAVALIGPIVAEIAALKIIAGAAGVAKLAIGATTFLAAYTGLNGAFLPDITLIPTYSISPEELFKGEILLFDVNIFNPKEVWVEVYLPDQDPYADAGQIVQNAAAENNDAAPTQVPSNYVLKWDNNGVDSTSKHGFLVVNNANLDEGAYLQYMLYKSNDPNSDDYLEGTGDWIPYTKNGNAIETIENVYKFTYDRTAYIWQWAGTVNGYRFYQGTDEDNAKPMGTRWITADMSQTSSTTTGSEATNQNGTTNITKVNALDTQVMTAEEWKEVSTAGNAGYETYKDYKVNYYYYYKDRDTTNNNDDNKIITSANNSALELKNTTAKWYYAMRNLAVVALMVVLVYMGIRMLTSSVASEKAKYKQMIIDWLVALCLIFIMQYIMVFANNFTESIIELFSSISNNNIYEVTITKSKDSLIEGLKSAGLEDYIDGDNVNIPTNLMGKVRLLAEEQSGTSLYIGYAVCFLILVLYTIIFTFVYAKRLLYTIFLTIIAPLVAISYPIDKIGDGKSQAFDMWLKEYIFNLIIQPFHLLLYIVLISTAFDLAGSNVIYSIVAIGFMIPAEKFLRKMFGFDKASTPGFLGGAAGAAVAMTAISKIGKFADKGSKSKGMGDGKGDRIKFAENDEKRGPDKGKTTDDLLNKVSEGQGNTGRKNLAGGQEHGVEQGQFQDSYNDVERAMFEDEEENINLGAGNDANESSNILSNENNIRLQENGLNNNNINELNTTDDSDVPGIPDEIKPEKTYGQAVLSRAKSGWEENFGPLEEYKIWKIRNREDLKTVAKRYGKTSIKLAKNGAPTMKKAAQISAGVVGAGLGAAAGVASGDPGNVVKNAGLGAYAFSSGSKGAMGRASAAISSAMLEAKETREANIKEQYGNNYSKYLKQKLDEKFLEDKERAKVYADELGLKTKEDIKAAMQDALKYRQYGITDDKTIIKAMKSDGGNETNRASADRIAAAQFARTSKTQKEFDNTIEKLSSRIDRTKVDSIARKIKEINRDDNLI